MYISNVHIENFRNFTSIDVPLSQFTMLVGKNDTGKTNLIEAINILLYNSKGNYYAKSLSKYDFNVLAVSKYQDTIKKKYANLLPNFDKEKFAEEILKCAPKVVIRLRFSDTKNEYEKGLLKSWLNGNEDDQYFEIEYRYFIKSRKLLIDKIQNFIDNNLLQTEHYNFEMLLDLYDYDLISTNNEKTIDFTKIKNFVANTINAERDSFSSGDTTSSTRTIARIIDSSLNIKDRADLVKRYRKFFDEIQGLSSFRNIYKDITEQNDTISKFIEEIKLTPNAKKYRDILENITISYGNDMLFQRGLGTRNLILMLTLYSYFLNDTIKRFNMVCIEEPEAHLDINSMKVALEFFSKSKDKNSLVQLLISTHSNQILNKLELKNITLISDDHTATSIKNIDQNLTYYLAKRENFDTLNLMFASKVILVEGATEEIYINCILQHRGINSIKVISIGQKGFLTFIELWKNFHTNNNDKLGIVRDYDYQDNAKSKHEACNTDNIKVVTASGKEFECDLINQGNNLETLNTILSEKLDASGMYNYMTYDKLESIIKVCESIDNGTSVEPPTYIATLLDWIIT